MLSAVGRGVGGVGHVVQSGGVVWCGVVCATHVGLPLRGLAPHEGVRRAVLGAPLAVAGLVVALELAGAPARVAARPPSPAALALLTQLHIVVDHVVWVCTKRCYYY